MTGTDFEVKNLGMGFAELAPKGKLPYIEHDGLTIADSGFIIDYLKKTFGDPLDSSLTPSQKAVRLIIRRTVEEHIWWVMNRERWWAPENPYWNTPGMLEEVDRDSYEGIRDESRRKCLEHGVGAFSDEELDKRGTEDIDALSALLDNQSYFLGERETSIDATTYAFLWQIINAPYTSQLKDTALERSNLLAYVHRVNERWFSEDPMSIQRESIA